MSRVAARPWHVAVGALAAGLALSQVDAPLSLAAAAGLFAGLSLARAPLLAVIAAALLLGGSAFGAARLDALDRPSTPIGDGRAIAARAHLLTRARPSAFGASAEARIATGRLAGARVLLRLGGGGASTGHGALPSRATIGDELSLAGTLRRPANHPDASFDFAAHLRGRGIAGELDVERVRLTGGRRGGVAGALDGLRRRAERSVAAGLPEADAALALGMVLGEDEEIDSATRDDWRDAGLSHLLAVSGQNVMLLMALALPMLVAAGLGPRGAGHGAALPGGALRAAGGRRAVAAARRRDGRRRHRGDDAVPAVVALVRAAARRRRDPGPEPARGRRPRLAAVVRGGGGHSGGRPPAGRAAEAGRAGAGGPAEPRRVRLPRGGGRCCDGLCEGIAITVAATVATAPLLAYHFGSVPLAGLPANLLALPAVAPAMWLGMVKATLGVAGPVLPGSDRFAELLGPVTHVPIAYLDGLAERCATLPGGRLRLPLHSPAAVVLAYAAMTALLYAPRLARAWRARRDPAARRRPRPASALAPAPSSSPPPGAAVRVRSGPGSECSSRLLLVLAAGCGARHARRRPTL